MSNVVERRIKAQDILIREDISDNLKLHEVFQLYKEDLQKEYPQLYYALLAWRDIHLKELLKERSLHAKDLEHIIEFPKEKNYVWMK